MRLIDRHGDSGYTALELLVVMAIISLVFTTAVVYFHPFVKTMKIRTAASDMSTLMKIARAAAVTSRVNCTLQIVTDPDSNDYLVGTSPRVLWRSPDFGPAFKDIKPPIRSVVVYYSNPDPDKMGIPLSPSELPKGADNVFVRWFTPLPSGVLWMNEEGLLSSDEKEINGLRIVFNKYGAIAWKSDPSTPDGIIKMGGELKNNVIKLVEEDTSTEAEGNQIVKYLVITPATGSCKIMDYDPFWKYAGSDPGGMNWSW